MASSSDVAFSEAVKRLQELKGSRRGYAQMEAKGGFRTRITDDLARFIAERDSFYIATASADGQPTIQHRGGKRGFLKVIDDRTLAFADFKGNRQYVTAGNLTENDKVCLFLMDYPNRQRIKIWGRARVVDDDAALLAGLADADYDGRPEHAVVFDVAAWDINCPRHITPRFSEAEIENIVGALIRRIAELEAALKPQS